MKIILSHDFLKQINQENFKSLINIIKISNSSTVISIKGKILEIPYILNPNLKYIAEIKNNVLYIYERGKKTIFNEKKLDKDKSFKDVSKLLDKLYSFENKKKFIENEIKYLLFNELYSKIDNKEKKNKKIKQYFINNKQVDEYYFIFNLPYYNNFTRIFLKIDKKRNVFINMYLENIIKEQNEDFIKDLKLLLKSNVKNIIINFFDDKNDFYKNIFMILDINKIDIKI